MDIGHMKLEVLCVSLLELGHTTLGAGLTFQLLVCTFFAVPSINKIK
jgi:hypothetical protein